MSQIVRQRVERELAAKTIETLLAASPTYSISIDDGDDGYLIKNSRDPEAILQEMFSMDDDKLYVSDSAEGMRRLQSFGWVYFVWGNCGHDAMSDHTTNLEQTLKPVYELANELEAKYGNQ